MKYRFLAALLALHATAALAEPSIPDTPAGHALRDWMSAFNSGDRDQLEALKAKYHRDRPVEPLLDLRRQQGAFDILKVEKRPSVMSCRLASRASTIARGTT
jgi:hypothetical protein